MRPRNGTGKAMVEVLFWNGSPKEPTHPHRNWVKASTSYPEQAKKKDGTLLSKKLKKLFTKGVIVMTLSYDAARANLYSLLQQHPDWSHAQFCRCCRLFKGTGQKMAQTLSRRTSRRRAGGADLARPLSWAQARTAGHTSAGGGAGALPSRSAPQKACSVCLGRCPSATNSNAILLCHSSRCPFPLVARCIASSKAKSRIHERRKPVQQPLERPAPMANWQMDCKDVGSVPADPEGERQHVVETLNIIDTGTSVLLDAHVRSDFTAQTAALAT